ncbi:hypothetical protein HLH36_16735 [Gluconacetobacter aggeris]|uniref:Uncharacterized protein n=1 Tax=Gluconacetobacter aggeris TaxID=1286186 RepID=A0A7W4IVT9_9PROT|nr:hypothetical protein [Gluconacetobacter aggeris]MBB2169971.1 hypothetical protein [Gluconacetobacter aggeris]
MCEGRIDVTAATLGFDGALEALQNSNGAMSLQLWMELNRDALLEKWGRRRLNWQALCRWFEEVGLTNRNGTFASVACAKVMWNRVGKKLEARRAQHEIERAEEEALAAKRAAERAAAFEAARAVRDEAAATDAILRRRMERADRAAASKRRQAAEEEPYRREAGERLRARQEANGLIPETGTTTRQPTPAAEPARANDQATLVTLDLPYYPPPYVSARAYLPHDPSLPPVKEGDICKATGARWEIGGDLPGYPSKRNYEYEKDWLRDVGRLLRAKHPTNLTMTREEKYVMQTAKSRIPNLY